MSTEDVAARGIQASKRWEDQKRRNGFEDDERPHIEAAPAEFDFDGAALLDDVRDWFRRFIAADPEDHDLLALFTVHTHLAKECYTTPRLQIDSAMPNSGKTTVCEHLSRLACNAVHFASLTSTALLVRILQGGTCTLLIDEVDRLLDPGRADVKELIAVLNSGYKVGATRPVLVPGKGDSTWQVEKMPTYAPAVLSGNSPHLPDDTRTRCIRILLMPDIVGAAEDSDWEEIEAEATALHSNIARYADAVRDTIKDIKVDLPAGCTGRSREKWRPLMRVAAVAGGKWPEICTRLVERGLREDEADRADGLLSLPPAMIAMYDLRQVWPEHERFVGTKDLVQRLIWHNREQWSEGSAYGKRLTETRLGKMIGQVAKVHSKRDEHNGPRGYYRADLESAWNRLGIKDRA